MCEASIPSKLEIKEAMILAAGFGKRLSPLTLITPKPLISLNGIPMLQRVLTQLKNAGVDNVVVNTHYLAPKIHDYLATISEPKIQISHESDLLETGGGIANALHYFKNIPILTVNSDIWWQEDISEKGAGGLFHTLKKCWDPTFMDALLVVVAKKNALFYQGRGDFYLNKNQQLNFLQEANINTTPQDPPYIYTGIQLLHPRLLGERKGHFGLLECYRDAVTKGRLYGLELKGKWSDAGTLEAFNQLDNFLKNCLHATI